jgi:predicted AlkP superfamily pyrophosphatase or phosphodiesterase
MSVHRLAKYQADDPFTRVPNTSVNDARLDLKARGLLLFMLSKPDGWTFRERSLADQAGVGRDQVRAALHKLIECGYVVRRWEPAEGSPPIMVTEVYDTPIAAEVGFPEVGKPDSGETRPLSNEVVLVTKDVSKATRNSSMTGDWQPEPANWQAIIATPPEP